VNRRSDCKIGAVFGRLTVIGKPKLLWRCGKGKSAYLISVRVRCSCGVVKDVWEHHLLSGRVKSCGCLRRELSSKRATTHGQRKTRLYITWVNMHRRCYYPKCRSYGYCGSRGIKVCRDWHNFSSFYKWAMKSGYNDSLTIDRINNNRNYCPSNCRWATWLEQRHNQRRCKK
jgi:hypothetical protein